VKIAFVYPHLYIDDPRTSLSDSLGILTYEMARRMSRSCDVTVYARRGWRQARETVDDGIRYRRVNVLADQALTLVGLLDRFGIRDPQRPFYTSRWYYASYVAQVAQDLSRHGCDVVHVFTFPQFARTIRRANPNARIVLHMEDHSLAQRDAALMSRYLKDVDVVIGCSEYVTSRIRTRFPEVAPRCHTVFNGVDVESFAAPDGGRPAGRRRPRQVLYVGRISPEKGLHVLVDAFAEVAGRHDDVELVIVGPEAVAPKQFVDPFDDDPRFDELRSFYVRRGGYLDHLRGRLPRELAGRVHFTGVVPYARIRQHYRDADVFVIPSLWHEPFGMPTTEAMAAGVPLVATRGGAFTEIVDEGVTGLLVERGDAAELAAAMDRLLSDDALRTAMGAAARDRARALFAWDDIVARFLALYRGIETRDDRRAVS
jgi:spore coat protein SA